MVVNPLILKNKVTSLKKNSRTERENKKYAKRQCRDVIGQTLILFTPNKLSSKFKYAIV